METDMDFNVHLTGPAPWGFRLQGGKEFKAPLRVAKVEPGGRADLAGVTSGDFVKYVNGVSCQNLQHSQVLSVIKSAGNSLTLSLNRSMSAVSFFKYDEHIEPAVTTHSQYDKVHTHDPPITYNNINDPFGSLGRTSRLPSGGKPYMKKVDESWSSEDTPKTNHAVKTAYGATEVPQNSHVPIGNQQKSASPSATPAVQRFNTLPGTGNGPVPSAPVSAQKLNVLTGNPSGLAPSTTSTASRPGSGTADQSGRSDPAVTWRQRTTSFGPTTSSLDQRRYTMPKSLNLTGRAPDWYKQMYKEMHTIPIDTDESDKISTTTTIAVEEPSIVSHPAPTPARTYPRPSTSGTITPSQMNSQSQAAPESRPYFTRDFRSKSFSNLSNVPTSEGDEPKSFAPVRRNSIKSSWYKEMQKGGDIPTSVGESAVSTHSPSGGNGPDNGLHPWTSTRTSPEKSHLSGYTPNMYSSVSSRGDPATHETTRRVLPFQKSLEVEKARLQFEADDLDRLQDLVVKQRRRLSVSQPASPRSTSPISTEPGAAMVIQSQSQLGSPASANNPNKLESASGTYTPGTWSPSQTGQPLPVKVVRELRQAMLSPGVTSTASNPTDEAPSQQFNGFMSGNVLGAVLDIAKSRKVSEISPTRDLPKPMELLATEPSRKTSGSISPSEYAIAVYKFEGQNPSELSFSKGDTILVLRSVDENWYEGLLHSCIGIFPKNYVQISTPSQAPVELMNIGDGEAVATYNFQGINPHELSFKKNDPIRLIRRIDDNWFEAEILGAVGIVPVSYIQVHREPKVLSDTMGSSGTSLKMNSTKNSSPSQHWNGTIPVAHERHHALYPYHPQTLDELELLEGDNVLVMEKCEDGWFVGTSERTGKVGSFPGNYVAPVL